MKGSTILLVAVLFMLGINLYISYNNYVQIQNVRLENAYLIEQLDSLNAGYELLEETDPSEVIAEVFRGFKKGVGELFENNETKGVKESGNGANSSQVKKTEKVNKLVVSSKYRMEDRYVEHNGVVKPEIVGKEAGEIIIDVKVDWLGNVQSAKEKSNTGITDEEVIEACKKGALKTRFNSNTELSEKGYQSGTITYTFSQK